MEKGLVWCALAVVAGLLLGVWCGYWLCGGGRVVKRMTVCDTVRYIDTVVCRVPVARDSVVVRYVTRVLPVAHGCVEAVAGDSLPACGGVAGGVVHAVAGDSVAVDSVAVCMPITQKRYDGDGYRAWVSGYAAVLDSICVFQRTSVVRERSYKPPNKWHIGITGGVGYGFSGRMFEPYVGIGIVYSLFSF